MQCSSCPLGTLASLTPGVCYGRAFRPMTFAQCLDYCTEDVTWRLPCLSSQAESAHLGRLLFNASAFWVGVIQMDKDDEPAGSWHRIGCDETVGNMFWLNNEPNNFGGMEECAVANSFWGGGAGG